MNSRFIFFCLIFVYYNVNAQSNLEQQGLDQERILELESQKSQQSIFFSEEEKTPALKPSTDDDNDGMDDDWEIQNGLDPNNPTDAWQDADGDYILNLFEAQLITDPNDLNDPAKVDFNDSDIQSIQNALDMADEQKLVIRLSEGEYFMNYLQYFSTDYYVMIQGGWNEDFTSHDPSTYRTILNGSGGSEVITIGESSGAMLDYSAVILQGLEITEAGDFSLSGGIQFVKRSLVNRTSIYDCHFYRNTYYGIGIVHWTAENINNDNQFFLVNTGIYNNPQGGIYTQVSYDANAQWHIINTTIHNPNSIEGGIDGLTSSQGNLNIDLHNTINWGNSNYSFNFFTNDVVSVFAKNCVIDEVDPAVTDYAEFNNLMTDPLFVDVTNNDISLTESSPCIDAGTDFGLPYAGNAPDIGAKEYGLVTNTIATHEVPVFGLVPNILNKGNRRIILNGLPDISECTVYIFDEKGSVITQDNMTTNNGQIHYSIADYLSPSTYFITVDCNGNRFSAQRLVITE